tara:strand:+ start:1038 stop:1487 length:450 start_codon:yes stop_codon:yes gene_type:complete
MNKATVDSIYVAESRGSFQKAIPTAQLKVGLGLEGDRFFNTGIVTLIELERIVQFIEDTGLDIGFGETRRNIVTKHLRLNALVGKEFVIGEARLLGTELCEPCASLGKRLSNTRLTPREIVKAFTHKAGIRAKIIASGSITPGTLIQTI